MPLFPTEGLDGGWPMGMAYAVEHHLRIGRDVVFTYGPYATLSDRLYDPALRGMLLGAPILLATSYAAGVTALGRPVVSLIAAALVPLITANDAFAFTVCLPCILACARAGVGRATPALPAAILLLAPALAILPLVKLSYLPCSAIGFCLCAWLLLLARRLRLLAVFSVLSCAALPLLWLAAGQSLSGLPAYFINGFSIIAGYASGMETFGPLWPVEIAVVLACVMMGFVAVGARRLPGSAAWPLLPGIAGLIFVTLKAGFVRQDLHHEVAAVGAAGLALLILAAWLPRLPAAAAAMAGAAIILSPLNADAGPDKLAGVWTELQTEIAGANTLVRHPAAFDAATRHALAALPKLPWHPDGTADIYSYGQAALLASGLAWAPRPVFQSYSAYTPVLARANAVHLLNPAAADNIFFRPEPIDGHLPALEDGASWPALLSLYEPAGYDPNADLAWLTRNSHATKTVQPGAPVLRVRRRLGEAVPLPGLPALWATLRVEASPMGAAAAILAKSPPLHITLRLADGTARSFRFIPGMAAAGFVLSPLVLTTGDFIRLRRPLDRSPALVTEFSVDAPAGTAWLWRRRYDLVISSIAFPAIAGAAPSLEPQPAPVAMPAVTSRPTCFLDMVDGVPISGAPVYAHASFNVQGWAAFDVQSGLAADRASLTFISKDGTARAVPARLVVRNDVGPVFHHPELKRVGLNAVADVSALPPGSYSVSVILQRGTEFEACATGLRVVAPTKN